MLNVVKILFPQLRYGPQSGHGANPLKRVYDDEDVKIRSIIKEEDLNQMANIGNDIGWAGHEDIDYKLVLSFITTRGIYLLNSIIKFFHSNFSQKLKFSDDEDDDKGKDNRNKVRSKNQASSKTMERSVGKKETDKENDLRSSKVC